MNDDIIAQDINPEPGEYQVAVVRYFVDESGVYLGGFVGGDPPEGATEVEGPPQDGRQTWTGNGWGPIPISITDYQRAIEAHVEATAQAKGYKSDVSCASHVASTVAAWRAEAEAFVAWRDAVWAYAFAELSKVDAGTRRPPTITDLISELPPIVWP